MNSLSKSLMKLTSACLIAATALTSCATEISSDVYAGDHVGETSETFIGTVISSRMVKVGGSDNMESAGAGITTGAIAGGVAGNQFGSGRGNGAATAAGALIGAFAGAMAEKKLKEQQGIEYVIKLDNGSLRTVVQGPGSMISQGQRVLLMVSHKGRSRVIPYNGQDAYPQQNQNYYPQQNQAPMQAQ